MRVLVCDDELISREILSSNLTQWGYECVTVENGFQALDVFERNDSPSLFILDWLMPEMDGLEVCRRIRNHEKSSNEYTYIMMCTSQNTKDDLIEGMKAGVDDFISKPPDWQELKFRLRVGERIIRLHKQLRYMTTHDSLTGLWNRFAILETLDSEIIRSNDTGSSFSIAIADIDNFKTINDTYGHQSGDMVLSKVSEIMKSSIRSGDQVGRYGGEEFLFVFPECTQDEAVNITNKVLENIYQHPFVIDGKVISVSASFGVAAYDGALVQQESKRLITKADNALYASKAGGKNRVSVMEDIP